MFRVDDATIWKEDSFKLLGILIDSDLSFDKHVKMICKKASQKLTAPLRIVTILTGKQRKMSIKSFFDAQFNYCPLLWMFCSCSLNHRIKRLNGRAFWMTYKCYISNFVDLLIKITQWQFMREILGYKIAQKLAPTFIRDNLLGRPALY